MTIYRIFVVNNVVEKYIKNKILTKTAENESEMDCKLLAIYKNAKTEYSSFDILNSQDFILNWNDVMFRKRHYVINPPRIGNIKFRPLIIDDEMSCPAFNEAGIKAFLQQRLPHIHCVAKENALTVLDKIDLAVAFHYMKTVNVKDSLERHRKKNKKSLFKFKIKNFMDAIKQGEYYNKAQLHKLKSRYVSFLASYQLWQYKLIPCNERILHKSNDTQKIEYAFIFTLPSRASNKIILAVENLNPARATMLFIIDAGSYKKAIQGVFNYITGPERNKRSSLRECDRYGLGGIRITYQAVDHRESERYSWDSIIRAKVKTW